MMVFGGFVFRFWWWRHVWINITVTSRLWFEEIWWMILHRGLGTFTWRLGWLGGQLGTFASRLGWDRQHRMLFTWRHGWDRWLRTFTWRFGWHGWIISSGYWRLLVLTNKGGLESLPTCFTNVFYWRLKQCDIIQKGSGLLRKSV